MRDTNEPTQHPGALLDAVMAHLDLRKDLSLADALGMSRPQISKLRSGVTPINAAHLVRMYDKTGLSIDYLRKILYQS
jgi:transcriptional regulator with XRE-family HTH domain